MEHMTPEDRDAKLDQMARHEDARAACEVLEAYGRTCLDASADVDRGRAIGKAVASCNSVDFCVRAAIEMLEDCNCHLMVSALWALWKGRWNAGHRGNPPHGSVTPPDHNRWLIIRLPKWW